MSNMTGSTCAKTCNIWSTGLEVGAEGYVGVGQVVT